LKKKKNLEEQNKMAVEMFREKYSVQYKIKDHDDDIHYDYIDQTAFIEVELDVNDGVNHEKAKERILKRYPKAEIFNVVLIETAETLKAKEKLRARNTAKAERAKTSV
jgi:hypothetical protein